MQLPPLRQRATTQASGNPVATHARPTFRYRFAFSLRYTINRAMLISWIKVLTSWVICGTIRSMTHSAPHPSLYGTSRRKVARQAERWAVELLHEELFWSDEVRAAQHESDLEREEQELARRAAGQDPNAPMPWDADWQPPAPGSSAAAVAVNADDVDDWIPPDVNAAYADQQRMLALAKAAHSLMPTLRAADRVLAPTVLATTAAQAQVQIHAIIPRREQLAALLLARVRAIATTIATQLLPAPRAAALPRAA
jgi:hypothetical protein